MYNGWLDILENTNFNVKLLRQDIYSSIFQDNKWYDLETQRKQVILVVFRFISKM